MDVALADPAEIAKVDAELVGGVGGLHERQRRLADADDADVLAFDQVHFDQRVEQLRQRRRAHPPGRAAAEDDDTGWSGIVQRHGAKATTPLPLAGGVGGGSGLSRRTHPPLPLPQAGGEQGQPCISSSSFPLVSWMKERTRKMLITALMV